jgi:MFS family permease
VAFLASLAACAWDGGLPWLAGARAVQGLTGAIVVALVPGSVMAATPERRRQLAGGVTIAGVGFAVVPSLLIPSVAPYGPTGEWLVYSALGTLCTIVAWPFIARHMRGRTPPKTTTPGLSREKRRPYAIFLVAYALSGVMITPNALFLADYLRLDLHAPPAVAGALFSWFAVGLGVGGVGAGVLAHRRGSLAALIILTIVGAAGNTVILASHSVEIVSVASFFMATWLGGTIALASLRALELVGTAAHGKYWALLCLAYSGGMLVASTAFAEMLSRGVKYIVFSWIVEGLTLVFIVLVVLSYRRVRPALTTPS